MSLTKIFKIKPIYGKHLIYNSYGSAQTEKTQKMKLFWEMEALHAANVNYHSLSDEEKLIHDLHDKAVMQGHFTYSDPKTNERIRTRLRHFLRGKCCGNACRHCVYNHDNVIDEHKLKVRKFNSSFWTYPENLKEPEFDESCYFDGSNLRMQRSKPQPTTRFDFGS